MRKLVSMGLIGMLASGGALALTGCHADEDDPAGQAEELSDPVRRSNAIANLKRIYTRALDCCKKEDGECVGCKRTDPEVKKVADAIHEDLTQVFLDAYPQDSENTLEMLRLMKEMRDPRTIPALVKALDWRVEVTEDHAITAAKALREIEIPKDKEGKVVDALCKALDKVDDDRKKDNRIRIATLRTLGDIGSKKATSQLVEVMTSKSPDQNFLINRMAAQQLGTIADPDSVPALIKGLFLFDPNNPARRMNDVAAEALVRIGRPAYDPLLKVLEGEHEAANKIAKSYIEAIAKRSKAKAQQMSVEDLTSSEATYALGSLGFRDALEPLLAETKKDNLSRQMNAAIQIVRLNVKESDVPKIRETLKNVYDSIDGAEIPQQQKLGMKAQLMSAVRHMYDAKMMSFLMKQAKDDDLHPAVRIEAVKAYSLLANKAEVDEAREVIEDEPKSEDGGYREKFEKFTPALDAAEECDEKIGCWTDKLESDEKIVLQKASYMLGRLGRGKKAAIDALVGKLDHNQIEVRLAALNALDHIAVDGSEKAIEKIQTLREEEQGRSIWSKFSKQALPVQARLRSRGA